MRRAPRVGTLAQHHAGKERPQGKAHLKDHRCAESNADRGKEDKERKKLARTGLGDLPKCPRNELSAHEQHDGHEGHHAQNGRADHKCHLQQTHGFGACLGSSGGTENLRHRRQQHENDDRGDVFHNEPTDRDLSVNRIEVSLQLKRLEKHHGRSARQTQAEDERGARIPMPDKVCEEKTEHGCNRHLKHGAGDGDVPHLQEILNREMQSDAEHQQNHAQLRELAGQLHVGRGARRIGAADHARKQIAHERRKPQSLGQIAEHKGKTEGKRQSRDKRKAVIHW